MSYPTLDRHRRGYSTEVSDLGPARPARPASLVRYDVSTLYVETDAGDGFREPGFSKKHRLEPQITIGLLADASGFALMVEASPRPPHLLPSTDRVIYYTKYTADRARRRLRGIDEQVAKAARGVAGKVPVKRNQFIILVGADNTRGRRV